MTKKQHIVSSLVFLLVTGIVFAACYAKLGEKSSLAIHPYMMPVLTSGLAVFLSIIRLIIGIRMPADTGEQAKKKFIDIPKKSLITMCLIAVYALCIKKVGFVIMTFLYMFAQMVVLKEGKKNWVIITVMSLVMSVGVYFLFAYAFDILLPAGILDFG